MISCHLVIMYHLIGAQRAFAIKAFYENNDSVEAARREFRWNFNSGRHNRVPSAHAINTWLGNFDQTGSALKKKPSRGVWIVQTPDNIETVWAAVIRSPRHSIHCHVVSLQFHRSSVQRKLSQALYWKRLISTRRINVTQSTNDDSSCTRIVWQLFNFEKW